MGVTHKSDETVSLEAKFGWLDSEQSVSNAEIRQKDSNLILTAASGAKIAANYSQEDRSFTGTFFSTDNKSLRVKITKISENDLQTRQPFVFTSNIHPNIEKPSADVPASCADFVGGWVGTWANSGITWLWVVKADNKCNVEYAYTKSPNPKKFTKGEVKKGVLEVTNSIGTNYFEFRGGKLFDRFVGSGVDDTLVFEKVDSFGDSLVRLIAKQKAEESAGVNPIPPTSDVPASCAAFFGSWVGTWGYGIPDQRLRVIEVDAKCIAKYSYANSKIVANVFKTSEIKDGVLSFVCNSDTGGTCVFKPNGNTIDGSYSNSSGGRNNATFKKVQ